MGSLSITHWVITLGFVALVIVPSAKILRRAGHSGWWSVVTLIPFLNLVGLWVFANSRWPAVDGAEPGPRGAAELRLND